MKEVFKRFRRANAVSSGVIRVLFGLWDLLLLDPVSIAGVAWSVALVCDELESWVMIEMV